MSTLLSARARTTGDENLIPLINIVFLLLIFFMIAGQISSLAPDEIEPPVSGSDAAVEPTNVVVTLSRELTLTVNGDAVPLDRIGNALQEIASHDTSIALKADKDIRAADIDPLLSALRTAGFVSVTLFSQPAEQNP